MATKPGCEPLKVVYDDAVARQPKSWNEIEDAFLWAMADFDANVPSGVADMGDLQNGNGDFFNDVLALLLENCAGVTLYSRGGTGADLPDTQPGRHISARGRRPVHG